ncbi:uncharacterized protein LOC123302417 [Chrysoperla carnea]|uniref:uncharacterized protein LOC123302417 n=1 Tax=Chrysoperla carnea TaxID=189513 RepID=UPI001D07FBE9|nr:uncharacterized protein LOC123302417 [Chrysoperla carnea]
MAFKSVIVFLVASLNVFALAQPVTYLRDSGLQNSLVSPYYQSSLIGYPNFINSVNTVSSLGYPAVLSSPYVSPSYVSPGLISSYNPIGYSGYPSYSNQNLNQQISPVQVNF